MKKLGILIFSLVLLGGIVPSVLASSQSDVNNVYKEMLDRKPTVQEKKGALRLKIEKLKRKLNSLREREDVINKIYQRALKRNATENEVSALKRFGAPANRIRKQLFESDERQLAIKDEYKNLLGREPVESDLEFYVKTRSPFAKIKEVLSKSQERKELVKKFIRHKKKKEASGDEIENNRLRKISELKSLFGTPKEISQMEEKLLHKKSRKKFLKKEFKKIKKTNIQRPKIKRQLMPCVIAMDGKNLKGICRYEIIPRPFYQAFKKLIGEDVNKLPLMGNRILLVKFREMDGDKIRELFQRLIDKKTKIKDELPLAGYDQELANLANGNLSETTNSSTSVQPVDGQTEESKKENEQSAEESKKEDTEGVEEGQIEDELDASVVDSTGSVQN